MKSRLFIAAAVMLVIDLTAAFSLEGGQDTSVAKLLDLNRMGCRIELSLTEGGIVADRVSASGKITEDRKTTEPLPPQLFESLAKLEGMTSLRIDVKGGEKDRESLRGLTKLRHLHHLELFGRDVNDEVMISVSSMTNLESLALLDTSVGDPGLVQLIGLKSLRRIELGSFHKIAGAGIEALAKLRDLEYLRIYGDVEAGALSRLEPLQQLETVCIEGPFAREMLGEIRKMPKVQRIEIARAEVDVIAATYLRDMKNLRFLKLHCCGVTPEAVRILKALSLHQIECIGLSTEVLSEFAKGMPKSYGDLNVWN